MSGICGIVNFDGAPVDPEVLRRMAEASAYRGPDGIHYWIEGNVGLAHLALNTTPESLREHQPLVNRRGDLVLTADARVDNRDELIRTLTAKGHLEDKDPTDADLILAAYECWGEACPKEIIGDFAFAIWDMRERKLVCSRDPVGIRPLFFIQRGKALFVASTIASLLGGLGERPALNEPLLVDFLCWNFERWVYQTIYQDIFRVPASHTLLARDAGITFDRHWILGAQSGPRYKTDDEYVARFRELFEEAVRCRLRSAGPVGISVSGGLDSGSIASMAHDMGERGVSSADVRLYSCVFDERFPAADERQYLKATLDKCHRFPFTAIPGETLWGFKETSSNGGFPLDEPEIFPIRAMSVDLLRAARIDDCRIMLTGEGADQVLSTSAYWHPEFLLEMTRSHLKTDFLHFWRRSRHNVLVHNLRSVLLPVLRQVAPREAKRAYSRRLRVRSAPKWVNTQQIIPLGEEELGPWIYAETPRLSRPAAIIYRQITGGWYTALLAYKDSVVGHFGVIYWYPFLDRRLVDFTMSISPQLRFNNGFSKLILRQGMIGVLPEAVRLRQTVTHFSEVTDKGYRESSRTHLQALTAAALQSQSRYIEAESLKTAWRKYYHDKELPSRVLVAPMFLQDWLNSFESAA